MLSGNAKTQAIFASDDAVRAALRGSVARATESGQTRWAAFVATAVLPDSFACYAATERRDRFFWDRGEALEGVDFSETAVACGVCDEMESAGPDRFDAIRQWSEDVRARIDWIGGPRAASSPTFFGGFGFESESRGSAEWKSFPAARFVLPEWIVERGAATTPERSAAQANESTPARVVLIARVEPGASLRSVEAELEKRAAALDAVASTAYPVSALETEVQLGGLAALEEDGPEYRVRSDRRHAVFRGQVRAALKALTEGGLAKIVLARSLAVDHDGFLDVPSFLLRLRELYPTCTLVAMGRGDDTFLAATPETLVRVEGAHLSTAALAGSAPRGRNPDEDERFGASLMESAKERSEHAHVVGALREVLEPICDRLDVPKEPSLLRLFGIQHLESRIEATLSGAPNVLGLVEALHPTPAVGGVPSREAQQWIRAHEGLDRGWYAAPIGWLDLEGGGDFRVALRSALIRNGLGSSARDARSRARLFAGVGLVEGSVPEQELVETRIKLRALLAPLTEI